MIQYFHLKGLSPTNIKAELDSTLGESVPSFTKMKYWLAEFKRGRTSCQYEHRSDRPNEVTTTEMVKKIQKMVLDLRRLKVHELANMVNISKSAVHRILTETLDMRNMCPRWVPSLLKMEQKQRRKNVSIESITLHLKQKNSQNNVPRVIKELKGQRFSTWNDQIAAWDKACAGFPQKDESQNLSGDLRIENRLKETNPLYMNFTKVKAMDQSGHVTKLYIYSFM